jgi:protein SPT2
MVLWANWYIHLLHTQEKRKVDTLRKNRDYSCLFSDDADTQPPTKDHPGSSRTPLLVPKSGMDTTFLLNKIYLFPFAVNLMNKILIYLIVETQNAGPVNSARKSRVYTGQPATLSSTDRGLKGSGSLGKKAHAERKGTIAAGRNSLPSLKKKSPGLLPSSKGQELQPSLHNKRPQASIPGQKLRQQPQSQRPQGNGRQPPLQGRSLQGQLIGQNRSAAQNGRLKSAQRQLIPSSKFKVPNRIIWGQLVVPYPLHINHCFSYYYYRTPINTGFCFFDVEHLQASHGVEKCTVKRRKSNDDRQIMHKYDSHYCFWYSITVFVSVLLRLHSHGFGLYTTTTSVGFL